MSLGSKALLSVAAVAALAGSFAMGPRASAAGENIELLSDPTRYTLAYDPVTQPGGGEFGVRATNFVGMTVPAMGAGMAGPQSLFQTFCLELDEDVSTHNNANLDVEYNGPHYLYSWSLDTKALGGGRNIQPGDPSGDPLSPQVAYLYTQFWNGTLNGYPTNFGQGRTQRAADLQNAIWFFENEYDVNGVAPPVSAFSPGSQGFINAANAAVAGSWGNSIGNVRVLNLVASDNVTIAQSVLVMIASPPPPECCGYKELCFKYDGPAECVKVYAVEPEKCGGYYKTSLPSGWCGTSSVNPGASFCVYAAGCWTSGKFHDAIKLVVKNKCGAVIECVTVETDCTPPLVVGTKYGSFTLTSFKEADCKPTTTTPPCKFTWNRYRRCWVKTPTCDSDDDVKDWCGWRWNCDVGDLKDCVDWDFLRDCSYFKDTNCNRSFRYCGSSSWSSWCKWW